MHYTNYKECKFYQQTSKGWVYIIQCWSSMDKKHIKGPGILKFSTKVRFWEVFLDLIAVMSYQILSTFNSICFYQGFLWEGKKNRAQFTSPLLEDFFSRKGKREKQKHLALFSGTNLLPPFLHLAQCLLQNLAFIFNFTLQS